MHRLRRLYYNLKLKIRRFFTRGIKGYDRADLWDISDWFTKIMPMMLKDFKKDNNGYPALLTEEEWDNILDRMIYCFEEANESTSRQQNEYEDTFTIDSVADSEGHFNIITNPEENWEKYCKREDELAQYRIDMANEGLELFKKYFYELWW